MFLCPLASGLILVYRENKTVGVTELLKRSCDYQRIRARIWYVPVILLMPGIFVLSYGLMRSMGVPVAPRFTALEALMLFTMFFVTAQAEELGWSGYVIDPMQNRWGALPAGLFVGTVWAVWHIIPFLQAHRSLAWIAWQCLFTVAARVLIVWLYNNTDKSVFATALFHTMSNVSWLLFPIYGSYYDPRMTGLMTTFAAVVVTVVWGPRTLARR